MRLTPPSRRRRKITSNQHAFLIAFDALLVARRDGKEPPDGVIGLLDVTRALMLDEAHPTLRWRTDRRHS